MSSNIVFDLLSQGHTREQICSKTGMTPHKLRNVLSSLHLQGRLEVVETIGRQHVYRVKKAKRHIFDGVNSIFNVGAS